MTICQLLDRMKAGRKISLKQLDFTQRTYKALEEAGYITLDKLKDVSRKELGDIVYDGKPFGDAAVLEVRDILYALRFPTEKLDSK